MDDTLQKLTRILQSRKGSDPTKSYVASLYTKGMDKILQKVGEETIEVILAAKDNDRQQIIHETADLWFHTLVMLTHTGLGADDILKELEHRFGTSGHDEKSARK